MDLTGLGSLFDFGSKIIERVWPDPAQRAQATLELTKLQQSGELQKLAMETDLLKGQLEINKIEAASPDKFISYWRPAVGWIGVTALALIYWPKAIVLCAAWSIQVYHLPSGVALPPYPDLGLSDILGLLLPLLGIGGMRTAEKITGTEGNR